MAAVLMPVPKQQYFYDIGIPLIGGKVFTYAAGTNTPKATYTDSAGMIPQANPIVLNARGEPASAIFWVGAYKVEIRDALNNLIYTVDNYNTDPLGVGTFVADISNTSDASKGAALVGRGDQIVDSVAALRNLLKTSPSIYASTTGYYQAGDGGSGNYRLDIADVTSSDNGFTVIVAADGGRWKLMSLVDFNVKQAGAKGDGVTDDAAAFNTAISVCIALNRKKLKIPASAYRLGSRLTATLTGINGFSLEGDGSTVTELRYDQGVDGFAVFMDDGNWWNETSPSAGINLSGFTMSTKSLNTGVGLYIQGGSVVGRPPKRCILTDIEWRSFSGFAQCWSQCVSTQDAADIWFNYCRWVMGGPGNLVPIGVDIKGTAGKDPSGFYFLHCEALYGNTWINAGSNVEGIYLTQCSHVAGNRAMFWLAGAESGLHVIGGHYNNIAGNFYLKGIFDFEIIGALLFSEGHAANPFIYIEIQDGMRWTISGNVMNSGGTGTETGIAVNNSQGGAGYGGTISGNAFNNLTGSPINLTPSAAYVTVGLNSYNNCTGADVVNSNPNTNRVERRRYTVSQVVTLVGGAITETVNIPIPTGVFKSKPDIGNVTGEGIQCIGFYDQPSGTSTATNMKVDLRKLDGVNFAAGPIRLSVIAEQ